MGARKPWKFESNRETKLETVEKDYFLSVVCMQGDSLEDKDSARACEDGGRDEGGSKSQDSRHVLKAKPTGFVDRLNTVYERKKGVKVDSSVLAENSGEL